MLPKVLIVEDSHLVSRVIRHVAQQQTDFDMVYAENFAQCRALVEAPDQQFFAALVDLNLPDAPDGEVVDYVLQHGINTIVLTGSFDEERRDKLLSKGIVDYVTKEGRFSYDYAISLIRRIQRNETIKILLVDDSDTSRRFVRHLLKPQRFQLLEARNGIDAIKTLLDNPDIKLLITDYNMPVMDGFDLVQNIRHKYEKSDLAIIGLSSDGDASLSARFIKAGANDFLRKPFNHEEFHCRVRHNIEAIEHIEAIRDAADRDYLTGVYNRRYFFARGAEIHDHARRNNLPLAVAALDLDHFKRINDTYGYAGGDFVLQAFTRILTRALQRFLIARPSGEEFFVLLPGLDHAKAIELMSSVREVITSTPIDVDDTLVYLTFSAGVSNCRCESLPELLGIANDYLYRAKQAGRNLIIGDEGDDEETVS